MYKRQVWGFNGTERPGAVYLASVLATHAQKGLPAFGIYGHDVQEADDTSIPEDVKEKLLRDVYKRQPQNGSRFSSQKYSLYHTPIFFVRQDIGILH